MDLSRLQWERLFVIGLNTFFEEAIVIAPDSKSLPRRIL